MQVFVGLKLFSYRLLLEEDFNVSGTVRKVAAISSFALLSHPLARCTVFNLILHTTNI